MHRPSQPKRPDPAALSVSGSTFLSGSWKQFPSKKIPEGCGVKIRRSSVQFANTTTHSNRKRDYQWNDIDFGKPFIPVAPSTVGKFRIERNHLIGAEDLKRRLADSFENNRSFPLITRKTLTGALIDRYESGLITPPRRPQISGMDAIRVDGANGLRFSARRKGCFTPGAGSPFGCQSSPFVGSTTGTAAAASGFSQSESTALRLQQSGMNPNKAVFTIDSKSSRILIVNNNACQLLGHTPRELCDMLFSDLLTNKNKSHVSALAEGQLNSEDGTMVLLSGKVVEMNTKYNSKIAVSLWIRQIDSDGRCLAVAEPVERRVAQILVDQNGCVLSGDYEALVLFQLDTIEQFCGMDITALIPAIQMPVGDGSLISKHIRKQKATGRTSDGVTFPLCLMIGAHTDSSGSTAESADSGLSNDATQYLITIWVFQNISGLLVIDERGIIESCNHNFSMLMFGYAQMKILGREITDLIPNFGHDVEYLGETRSRNATNSSLDGRQQDEDDSETETDPVCYENEAFVMSECLNSRDLNEDILVKSRNEAINNISLESIAQRNSVQPSSLKALCKSMAETILRNNLPGQSQHNCTAPTTLETHPLQVLSPNCTNFVTCQSSQYDSLKTPVNETIPSTLFETAVGAIATANTPVCDDHSKHREYQLSDISEALRSVDLSTENINRDSKYIHDSPHFNPQHSEAGQLRLKLMTSTPAIIRRGSGNRCQDGPPRPISTTSNNAVDYVDGRYKGEAVHFDENILDILYTISSQTLPCGRRVFCVWICRDPDLEYEVDDEEDRLQNLTLTFNSIASTIENSLGTAIKHTAAQNNSMSMLSQCEEDQCNGEFHKHYTTLKQIGKGAYGYVKMAYRHTDRLLVVTKFIRKDKLTPQVMYVTEDKISIPLEIYFLTTVKHPNIVTVYDVFENENFFQMVMEKHGSGMDLFEFIDRQPMVDEQLCCFIFRQIVNAVDHLHSMHILHRDIKDENIIIDQNFHVKLIDFGSATYMEEGKLFSTFYGTTEYCSPEVLAGNKYAGPELEMWSLGITLFVIMFFENPFLDIEETLRAELCIPNWVSSELSSLLSIMLDKNPKTRCTMRQLQANKWIQQEINTAAFNFNSVVQCDPQEAYPEKYFEGPVYSSTTALSTMSPQDSLSLVDDDDDVNEGRDEDSLIDGEEDRAGCDENDEVGDIQEDNEVEEEEEEEEDDPKSQMSQDEPKQPSFGFLDCDVLSDKPREQLAVCNQHSLPPVDKPSSVCCPSDLIAVNVCQHNPHSTISVDLRGHSILSSFNNTAPSNCSSIQHYHQHNALLPRVTSPSQSDHPLSPSVTISCFVNQPSVSMSSYNTQTVTVTTTSTSSSKYGSDCSSVNESCPSSVNIQPILTKIKPSTFNVIDPNDITTKLQVSGTSNSVRFNHQQHFWSKSETNLCGKQLDILRSNGVPSSGCGGATANGLDAFKLSVYGVVSLNDLQETDEAPFSNAAGRHMNDLSKYHPTLNNISNDEICTKPIPDKNTTDE